MLGPNIISIFSTLYLLPQLGQLKVGPKTPLVIVTLYCGYVPQQTTEL